MERIEGIWISQLKPGDVVAEVVKQPGGWHVLSVDRPVSSEPMDWEEFKKDKNLNDSVFYGVPCVKKAFYAGFERGRWEEAHGHN
ncbi:peptidyl-prolyl cis-trans isomerase [Synechococcus sp. RSCCF101]|uniref:peptidyl-prolyl cis-trans isomerase n=1 Tax=Synechococcus sp. RSCCF101 TaxID=2511069 RepID=UPI00124711F3|nr:peptidyl-prolyl cis-trans isomerase [Synechococcus sp. RSCCF101]QEY31186.1 peptidyl-prolyl cis-trans isomerase [Synechococcus sp. RSCCF101]